MPERSIFRSTALEQLSTPERLDQYVAVADTRAWLGVAAAAVCVATALAWAFLGTITISVPARGIVRPSGDVSIIASPVSGTIAEMLAPVGARVRRGQVLATISTTGDAAPRVEIIAPRDGRVAEHGAVNGALTRGGERVMLLTSTSDSLDAIVYVAAADAARVRPGMAVFVLPPGSSRSAGGVKGRVVDVGALPASREGMIAALGSSSLADALPRSPVVSVRVALEPGNVRSGALTDAHIVVQVKRPFDLLRPGAMESAP